VEGKIMTENSSAETAERPSWLPTQPYSWPRVAPRLAEIVASKPEGYSYIRPIATGGCSYWHQAEGTPGCLIGQLMFNLGVPSTLLRVCDLSPQGGTISTVTSNLIKGLFDREAVAVLGHIQDKQDNDKPWAQALAEGEAFWAGINWAQYNAKREARKPTDG
jgi:hypothetical protein